MPEPRNPRVEDLERAAALHWQAPDVEPLGDWVLRAAEGFTGRANSALPLGDPSLPLAEAVTAAGDWGVLTAVEVDPARRRQSLGLAITAELTAAAADRGARRVLLQVETDNAPACALYSRCGFRDSHRYHYMLAP